jgi:hypothetical protein
MGYRPKPQYTPQQIANRNTTILKEKPMKYPTTTKSKSTITALTPEELMRRWDAMLGVDDDTDDTCTTPEDAIALMLADFDNMSPKQQSTYREDVRKASMAMDALVEEESARRDARVAKAAEQVYADRRRLMNDWWTDERGTFVGSLHPERTVRY